MRTTLRSRLSLLFMTCALAIAIPAMALADTLVVDGDVLDATNSKNSSFVLCPGDGSSVNHKVTINYNGSQHFANNANVTIKASVESAAQNFITATGASVTAADWNHSSDTASTGNLPLTVDTDWVAGTYKVTYTAEGAKAGGGTLIIHDTSNINISQATGCGGGGSTPPPPPANTAPTVNVTGVQDGVTYEIGNVPAAGCSVVDAEDTNESATPQVSAISGTLSAYGLGSQTVSCSYTDGGGLSGDDGATYTIVDTGDPTISDLGFKSGTAGLNGWYTSQVTNEFRASDSGAGFQSATPPLLQYDFTKNSGAGEEGSAVKINSGSVSDVAGNPATAIDSAAYKIDLSNPVLNVSGAANGAVFNVCDANLPAKPSFDPTDAISGLDGTQSDSWTAPSAASGVGTYTYSAQAKDRAGRTASETRTYTKTYGVAFGGVLQPINGGTTPELTDDNSRFKLGSTVPVKFTLTCNGAPVDNAVAKLNLKKADGTPDPGIDEAVSTAASTTGNLFRYDATNGQYIFNLSTKTAYTNPNGTSVSFAAGTYTLSVMLDDGSFRSVNIHIVK